MVVVLIAYLLLAVATGFGLTFVSHMKWDLEGRVATAVPLGFGAAAMLSWITSIPTGVSGLTLAGAAGVMLALLGICVRWTGWRPQLREEGRELRSRYRSWAALPSALILVASCLFFIPVYANALEVSSAGLSGGIINIWGDWAHHLSLAAYLANTQNLLLPANPLFAGTSLPYPFLPDFFSGTLTHLGADLPTAVQVSTGAVALAMPLAFYSLALRLTRHRWASFLAVCIFFLGSGVGFGMLANAGQAAGADPLSWLVGVGSEVVNPQHWFYSIDRTLNYQWENPLLFQAAQRNAGIGWPLGWLVLALVWEGLRSHSRREMLLGGVLVGLVPFVYAHVYMALGVFFAGAFLLNLRQWRLWMWFGVPAVLIGLPELVVLLPSGIEHASFFRIQLGWMAGSDGHDDNILWFWLLNTVLLIPLSIIGLLTGPAAKAELRRYLLGAWLLFVVANVAILQPWEWDNLKWFVWWGMLISIPAGAALARIFRSGKVLAVAAALILVAQTASGALDLEHMWQAQVASRDWHIADGEGQAVAEWARTETDPDTVLLTSWYDLHPVHILGARPLVISAPNILWTWGIDYNQRVADVRTIYGGGAGTQELLTQYSVGYVVIGPQERAIGANEDFYKSRYRIIFRSPAGTYEVFAIR